MYNDEKKIQGSDGGQYVQKGSEIKKDDVFQTPVTTVNPISGNTANGGYVDGFGVYHPPK